MTKELIELENHYFVLSDLLLQRVAQNKPTQLNATKEYLAKIEPFSIAEKTLYVAQLLRATEGKQEALALQKLEAALKQEKISVATISLMKQYMHTLN